MTLFLLESDILKMIIGLSMRMLIKGFFFEFVHYYCVHENRKYIEIL